MGVSLNGGTPNTPQNDHFLVGKAMVVGYHNFRKPPNNRYKWWKIHRELGFFYPEICGVVGAHLVFTSGKPIYFWAIYRSELILWANNNCSEQTARWLGISAENMVVKSREFKSIPKMPFHH